jgi:hypothetical protein
MVLSHILFLLNSSELSTLSFLSSLSLFSSPTKPAAKLTNRPSHASVKFSNGPFEAKESEPESKEAEKNDVSESTTDNANWKETIAGDLKQSAKESGESNTPSTPRKVLAKAHYYDRGTEPAKEPIDPPKNVAKSEEKSSIKNSGYEFEPKQPVCVLPNEVRDHLKIN